MAHLGETLRQAQGDTLGAFEAKPFGAAPRLDKSDLAVSMSGTLVTPLGNVNVRAIGYCGYLTAANGQDAKAED